MISQTQNLEKTVDQEWDELRQKLSFLTQSNPLPVIEWDAGLVVTEWNDAAQKLFGYHKSEVLGSHIYELIVPDSEKITTSNNLNALFQQKDSIHAVHKNLSKDGSMKICEWFHSPIIDFEDRVIGTISIVQNVTQIKDFEDIKNESEQRYQQILDSITDMVLVKSAKSRIVWANKAFRDYYGMSNEQLKNIIDTEFNQPDYTLQYIKDDAYVFETGQTLEIPEELVTRYDGEVGLFNTVKSSIRNATGEVVMTVGVSRDITRQKAAEKAIRESEILLQQKTQALEQTVQELQYTQSQLLQSDKMSSLGQLIAGVAHEINNPTSFIYSNIAPAEDYIQDLFNLIDLYQEHYPEPISVIEDELEAVELEYLKEDLPKLLSSMKMGAERIKQIVLSLGNFSRMDEAEFKAINIHECIESTLVILANHLKAQNKRLAIQVIKEYSDLPLVKCYAGQLNQVFMNLLVNAIYALNERDQKRTMNEMRENPSIIRIRTEISDASYLVMSFIDNEPGIPEKVQKRLFDPFFTTKPVGKGTGMGLSISYQIITEKHGGSLQCISTLGVGTEFRITIPLCQKL